MKVVNTCLKKEGIFLLHTIGGNISNNSPDPWISKYIFPNSILPSAQEIAQAAEDIFRLEDWHNFGSDYDKTLLQWYQNFEQNQDQFKNNYDERFLRMWKYYLLMCAGSFRAYKNHLWQIVFKKINSQKRYESLR